MEQTKEHEYLASIILNKGNIDKVEFDSHEVKKDFIDKFGFTSHYNKILNETMAEQYSDSAERWKIAAQEINKEQNTISLLAKGELVKDGIDVPNLLSDVEKTEKIENELGRLGFDKETIAKVMEGGLDAAETDGKGLIFTLKDTPEVKDILDKNNIVFEKTKEGLKVNSKLFVQEGFEIDNTPKNKKILDDNEITYAKMAESERTLFVPLKAKKVATLLIGSLILGPIPALAIQIAMNKTGVLDKLVDKHLLGRDQKEALDRGMTIKATERINGKDVQQYLYKDFSTGTLNKINLNDVQLPKTFQGTTLTPGQIHQLKEGKVIELVDKNGVNMAARIDMNEPSGIHAMYKEFKSDREYTPVPKPQSPDLEKLNYIGIKGAQGVNDIYGKGGANLEKDSFLERFNLKDSYKQIQTAERELMIDKSKGVPFAKAEAELTKNIINFKNAVTDIVLNRETSQSIKR
ncbi:hypothetical protein FACS189451_03930 [Bacteroidia bacterium]|nr:hypothetical protein FACS189446_1730 [Bacteroidia bacterium]GHT61585.1 hypothetical protein FACS189451_03930 [Bacteroidia bacterium]